jgi:hypothetical protein
MAKIKMSEPKQARSTLAYVVLSISIVGIVVLAGLTISRDAQEAKNVFNVVLPVFASWVGTILAFYFGRENFESANREVRSIFAQLTPQQ